MLRLRFPLVPRGLFFMPWLEGRATPRPDAHARGGFVGLSLGHTKGHMVRAVLGGGRLRLAALA